ncbi:keratin-associated protein 19-2-like [Osmia bicornis bicornis]|uniref:keratin-associated protein 19-2-like n=1 Tax=Osmia bicornis bicornis TaxID=1437191 RepID=UPI001EAF5590|nr:keratin-associated protein 19-2-like [Osmia bicornis bicornis]
MEKFVLIAFAAILAIAFAYPASEQETPLPRMAREAKADPHYGGVGGVGGIGIIGGFKVGGFGGYGHGYPYRGYGRGYGGHGYGGHGYGHGYGGYPSYGGGYGVPYGSASYASAQAGSIGFGR